MVEHKILVKWAYTEDGKPAFQYFECKSHGTISFHLEGLSCIQRDVNPIIKIDGEKVKEASK